MNRWREVSRRVIVEAIRDGKSQGLEGGELKKFISKRYPFRERAMHPYKVWLSEVKRQLGLLEMKPIRPAGPPRPADMPGQGMLFGG